jgi:NADH-quinone oxidoreductase subunit F
VKITDYNSFQAAKAEGLKKYLPDKVRIAVGMGTCGIGNGADVVLSEFQRQLKKKKIDAYLTPTGCFGFCAQEPLVNVLIPGQPLVIFDKVSVNKISQIVSGIAKGVLPGKLALAKIQDWDHLTSEKINFSQGYPDIPLWNEVDFFKCQKKIVLRDCGLINPEDIEEYIAVGGYNPLWKVLNGFSPEQVIEEVKTSKLRGRGGAGFPTGKKWEFMRHVESDKKYVICNADEGDPGAFMNRNEIESSPHMLIEGMVISAFAMGAQAGVVYIREEYPLAVQRLKLAILQAREYGVLGNNIFNSSFSFDLEIVEGAGAFVCGEETALIASIEGHPGRPRPRPPFPAQKGLWGKPTNINNVETLCNIPVIIAKGGNWFTQTGTQNSSGTKVFSLVGKIKNTGLVELPLGEPLQKLVYNIGGGTGTNKQVKAVQSGGPSGGCIPVGLFNTPVDYESLNALGAIMGSGGIVVMDDDNCMVDVARYFTEFTTSESCGRCTPCREGLSQSLQILKKVSRGQATQDEIQKLKDLGDVIKDTSLCGLGQTGPNPVITTLKYFKDEYDEHIEAKKCRSGVCLDLFISPCENSCPLHMNIPGFLMLLKANDLTRAFESIYRENPFPASSGRICHFHCKMRCRREDIDQPVSQGEVHRYIADTVYKAGKEKKIITALVKEKLVPTGKKIAIVGAGPAGLTAAFYLVRLGHNVKVFEANREPGGVLKYGIPQYRLPKSVLDKEIGLIEKLGVKIVYKNKIDAAGLEKLTRDFDAVFLATGAYKNMALGIPGEDLKGVWSGTKFLEKVARKEKVSLGQKVLIIGAGNVAVDAARSAFRFGCEVTIVYRRDQEDMPANKDEISEAKAEGIKFIFYAAPKQIIADESGCARALEVTKMVPGEFDISGRRKPVITEETYQIPCDTVMVAIGERVDADFLKNCAIEVNRDGTAVVDKFSLKTSSDKVYAGGDLVMGPSTAVEAMADGKTAAQAIDFKLTGIGSRFQALFKKFEYEYKVPVKPAGGGKQTGKKLSIKARRNNFKEVSLGLSKVQVLKETMRCLRCDVKTND